LILKYLRFWAKIRIFILKPKIVGVTGSVGKSSFVELLDLTVGSKYKTKTTLQGNSESGIPLEILGIRDKLTDYSYKSWIMVMFLAPIRAFVNKEKYNLLIAEMGIDSSLEPKNMSYLLSIIKPNIGVVLNVSAVHSMQFGKELGETDPETIVKRIAEEKMKLVTCLSEDSAAIYNSDNKYLNLYKDNIKASVITFGENKNADIRMDNFSVNFQTGSKFSFIFKDHKQDVSISNYTLFKDYGLTLAAVMATSEALGVSMAQAASTIRSDFKLPAGRFSLFKGLKNTTLIDSSYNSSPIALKSALEFLGSTKDTTRIAVLGDMRELGVLEKSEHEKAAQIIYQNVDKVILIGPLMSKYALPKLLNLNFPKEDLWAFENAKGVGDFIFKKVIAGEELILVKGSQNTLFLERIVEDLLINQKDRDKLCRQGKYWGDLKTRFFSTHPNTQIFPK